MNTRYFLGLRAALLAGALHGLALAGRAQQGFTAGNFVVARLELTGLAETNMAAPVQLVEMAFDGTPGFSVALPTADALPNLTCTQATGQLLGSNLTRSQDGRYLVLAGFRAAPGTPDLFALAPATVNRVVARVDAAGTVNTTSRLSEGPADALLRGAASADGSAFYVLTGSEGLRYVPLGNAGPAPLLLSNASHNLRAVQVVAGNVYLTDSYVGTAVGLTQLGQGLPTTAGQPLALLPGFSTTANLSPYSFALTDQSAAVPGPDVAYIASDLLDGTGGIIKFSLVGGTWVRNGNVPAVSSSQVVRTLAAQVSGSRVQLLAGNSTTLYAALDNAGYNAPPSASILAPVATAPANTVFRGIAPAPVAAPLATAAAASPEPLTAYPSPTTAELTLRLPTGPAAGLAYTLHDLLGRQLRASTLPASGQLSLAGLPAGTYLLGVAGAGTRRVCKE